MVIPIAGLFRPLLPPNCRHRPLGWIPGAGGVQPPARSSRAARFPAQMRRLDADIRTHWRLCRGLPGIRGSDESRQEAGGINQRWTGRLSMCPGSLRPPESTLLSGIDKTRPEQSRGQELSTIAGTPGTRHSFLNPRFHGKAESGGVACVDTLDNPTNQPAAGAGSLPPPPESTIPARTDRTGRERSRTGELPTALERQHNYQVAESRKRKRDRRRGRPASRPDFEGAGTASGPRNPRYLRGPTEAGGNGFVERSCPQPGVRRRPWALGDGIDGFGG